MGARSRTTARTLATQPREERPSQIHTASAGALRGFARATHAERSTGSRSQEQQAGCCRTNAPARRHVQQVRQSHRSNRWLRRPCAPCRRTRWGRRCSRRRRPRRRARAATSGRTRDAGAAASSAHAGLPTHVLTSCSVSCSRVVCVALSGYLPICTLRTLFVLCNGGPGNAMATGKCSCCQPVCLCCSHGCAASLAQACSPAGGRMCNLVRHARLLRGCMCTTEQPTSLASAGGRPAAQAHAAKQAHASRAPASHLITYSGRAKNCRHPSDATKGSP